MRDDSYFGVVAVAVAAVAVLGVMSLFVLAPSPAIPTLSHPSSTTGTSVARDLSIVRNASTGGFAYSTGQFTVPHGVPVVFTITNFDPTTAALPSPSDALVRGTSDGTMITTGAAGAITVHGLPVDDVSHTFSISDGYYHVNAPIPPATSGGAVSVTFVLQFDVRGTFAWGCIILCGADGAMTQMFGTLTVV